MIGLGDDANRHHAAVIGAGGGIGSALVDALASLGGIEKVYALSRVLRAHSHPRVQSGRIDVTDEASVCAAADEINEPLDLVIVATGFLHSDEVKPERRVRDVDAGAMQAVFEINTVGPAIAAKHFLPKLRNSGPTLFAAISARVGSIADNRLGGWVSYRASKAALNMVVKTLAIEHGRSHRDSIVVSLHPGTVDTPLSKPFSSRVPEGSLFDAAQSAANLVNVIEQLRPEDSGGFFAWDGSRIEY